MSKKKAQLTPLDEFLKIAKEHGMTYSELQQKESLGQVKIVNGVLFKWNKELKFFERY